MTPAQAEAASQQGVGTDICGEECVAAALVLAGAIPADPAATKAFVDAAWAQVNPGIPETQWGTTLEGERQVILFAASQYGLNVTISPISTADELFAAIRLGLVAVNGTNLYEMLGYDSNHFTLAYAESGEATITVVDPAHDIDGAWVTKDTYPIRQVLDGAARLFGPDQQFGWAFKFTKGATMEAIPGIPTEDAQNAQIASEAQQGKLLTDLIKALRTGQWTGPGSVDGIYCALRGGIPAPDYDASWPPANFR